MLRKEIRDAARSLVESLIVLFIIPFMYIGDKFLFKRGLDFASLIDTAFIITIILYAIYSGATVFQSERKDRAFEYLFSLPLTRKRIISIKILPRLAFLLVLGGAATAAVGSRFLAETGVTILVLFLSSLFLSMGVFSILLNLFGVGFMYLIFFRSTHVVAILLSKAGLELRGAFLGFIFGQLAPAALLLVPFGAAFWLTFKKMDARPIKLQLKTYYSIILPTLIILVSLIAAFFKAT
ncbi:MAG: hypothetical protein ABFD80_11085 [Acidobacteriota bacterium]